MMVDDLNAVPDDLPVPEDDGAAAHLSGTDLPDIALPVTDGSNIGLAALSGRTVIYAYPRTGQPGQPSLAGWDAIPGARGCTPQSCSFRDHFAELKDLGAAAVFGLSTQDSAYQREAREDVGYAFLIIDETDDELVGGVTLSNVRRGVTQAAVLGYWLGLPYIKRGYMTRAVQTVANLAFNDLHLHRLEAATMPSNATSIHVLERSGFRREGFARGLLKINGVWEDHILFALLAEDFVLSREIPEAMRR